MERLNILVLHCLGNPDLVPLFLKYHVFALQRNFPEHNYLYHDAGLLLPDYVVEHKFDAIILDVSFLTARWAGLAYLRERQDAYAFVRDSTAVKLAFPQDEYDCNVLLDDWMCDWNVDVLFSVIASGWEILYPRYHKRGDIRLGYTGYIDDSLISRVTKPFADRSIDIGYRAKKLPPYFGRIGETKWTIGRDVERLGRQAGLKVDIKLGDAATLHGDEWLEFINDSRFTLGSNSGSSLLDPVGAIQQSVRSYMKRHPDASFEEVEAACFPGQEGRYSFTAISPRVLEAALLNSAQILVTGEYSRIVRPWEHFVPIDPDAGNFHEVLDAIADPGFVQRMISQCREAILSVEELRYRSNARMILELIADRLTGRSTGSDADACEKVIARYAEEMLPKYRAQWRYQQFRSMVARTVAPYPKLYRLLDSVRRMIR